MATGRGVDQGKTNFLEAFLPENRDARVEAVNEAWRAGGNEGEISGSLISKTRSRLNLTARRGGKGGASGETKGPAAKGKARTKGAGGEKASKSGEAPSQANGRGERPGTNKSAFVEEALLRDPSANVAAVNRQWTEAGNEGSISDSVFYKIKREMGEDGGRSTAEEPRPEASEGGSPAVGRVNAPQLPAGREGTIAGPAGADPLGSGLSDQVVDEVEAGIDDLIFALKANGGMPQVEAALRAARRLLTRSNEG